MLTATEAAKRLGVTAATFYDWLSRSEYGQFVLRGETVRIEYFQGGANGQGRIRIALKEIERLQELMRVPLRTITKRRSRQSVGRFPGINVPLGRPPH